MSTMESAIEDLKDDKVPPCLYWSVEKVEEWIEKLGFPNYKVSSYVHETVKVLNSLYIGNDIQSHIVIYNL